VALRSTRVVLDGERRRRASAAKPPATTATPATTLNDRSPCSKLQGQASASPRRASRASVLSSASSLACCCSLGWTAFSIRSPGHCVALLTAPQFANERFGHYRKQIDTLKVPRRWPIAMSHRSSPRLAANKPPFANLSVPILGICLAQVLAPLAGRMDPPAAAIEGVDGPIPQKGWHPYPGRGKITTSAPRW
jgi:hypothetical protein